MTATRARALGLAMVGLMAALVAARSVSMGSEDVVSLLAWAVGTAAVGGAVMTWAAGRCRDAPIVVQLTLLTGGTVAIVGAGAWLGARAMFLSSHDLSALAVLLLAGGTASAVAAMVAGERMARATGELVGVARRIGDGFPVDVEPRSGRGELPLLARELAHASQRLEEARTRERLVEQSRRELVAWVSHDLRTPLAGMRALTEALEDGMATDPETVARYHRTLRDQVHDLTGLVDDLFELSRAQAGVIRLELERLSLGDLVSDAIAGITPVAVSKGVRLEGRINGTDTDLNGSAPELARALRNILENAVRHTPADGAVVVEVGRTGPDAYVAVADTGGGVAPEALPRIFEVGFRGDPARSPGGGAGLGLAIARSFVEAHRGRITVRNEDQGACFTVWLPVEPAL
ncbi:MAG: HAMP domain-containing sensor histidine kinase [Acidimicrobiales bacterium]